MVNAFDKTIGENSSGSYIDTLDKEGRVETDVTVAVASTGSPPTRDDETSTPLNTYTYRSIWRSFKVICALHGCYIPKTPPSMYCCEGHRDIAHKLSGPSVAACEVVGGFSSEDEIENCCGKALANKVMFQCDVGIPELTDKRIFTTLPSHLPDVFKLPRPYSTAYIFFSPPACYEEESADPDPTAEDETHPIWCPKEGLYHDLREHGVEEPILITPLRMGKQSKLVERGEWRLYELELKGKHIYCFTFAPATELVLTRFPKKTVRKVKKGRVYKDGVAGPVVVMPSIP